MFEEYVKHLRQEPIDHRLTPHPGATGRPGKTGETRKPTSAAGTGPQAPGQPDEEIMKNGQKAVAITTIESDPDTQCAVKSP